MKTIVLALTFLLATISYSQVSFSGPQVFGPEIGGSFYPIFQGSAGTFTFQGNSVPQISGVISSVEIDMDFTYSLNSAYADDFTFLVSKDGNYLDVSNNLLQIGGFAVLSATKIDWGCAGCTSAATPTAMDVLINFPTAFDFTDTNFVVWMGNGYLDTSAVGSWTINSIVFGGTNDFVGTNEFSFDVKMYPNPASEVLNISSAETITSARIISITGQQVAARTFNSNQISLNLSDLKNGTNICELTSQNGQQSIVRFVKN
ncbi:MAG: T9SS type A sorting domain-containing protein [Bacteroidota bacterium]